MTEKKALTHQAATSSMPAEADGPESPATGQDRTGAAFSNTTTAAAEAAISMSAAAAPGPDSPKAKPMQPTNSAPAASMWVPTLDVQCFTGSPLERSLDVLQKFDGTAVPTGSGLSAEASLVVVAGRSVCVRASVPVPSPPPSTSELTGPSTPSAQPVPFTGLQDLQALLLGLTDPQLDLNSEQLSFTWVDEDQLSDSAQSEKEASVVRRLPLYLLGRDRDERWTFAIDISSCKQAFLRRIAFARAAAETRFPIETGLRRRCVRDPGHKLYPRTDPVVIMLVESPDGQRALLGRSKKFSPGMYTCLSGFIDQCESIEEAVRREVREEAMIQVESVMVVGSQPWPIGRYGTCELMLACMAKARSYAIMVNAAEMEDVQWYDKSELLAAVQQYDEESERPLAEVQQRSMEQLGFWVPPPVAIAHHLIRGWASHDGPFFPSPPPYRARPSSGANALQPPLSAL